MLLQKGPLNACPVKGCTNKAFPLFIYHEKQYYVCAQHWRDKTYCPPYVHSCKKGDNHQNGA